MSLGPPICAILCINTHTLSKNTQRKLLLGTSQQVERVHHSASMSEELCHLWADQQTTVFRNTDLSSSLPHHWCTNSVCRMRGTQGSMLVAFSLEQEMKERRQGFFWKRRYSQGTVCISNILWQILASNVIAFSSDYEVTQNVLYKLQTYLKNKQFV